MNGSYWRYDIDTSAGNLTLPHLPENFMATIKDNLTLTHTRVKIDGTTIVTSLGKTCGSLQFLTGANMLIWSSFEVSRFTPCVDGVEVKLNRLTHDVHERIVVGYDHHGRAVYGALTPARAFDIRDSKEDATDVGTP